MSHAEFAAIVTRRLEHAHARADAALVDALSAYLSVLSAWNRRINLTAFDLSAPTDAAIDRLIVEPVLAASHILSNDHTLFDLGSGGGSPALPMRLAAHPMRLVLVESRVRKAAFLREAARQLGLDDVEVEQRRFEELTAR